VSAPPAHFIEAQAEQALWQELRNHSASLNNTLNETLRIHADLAWRVFQVRIFPMGFGVFCLPSFSCFSALTLPLTQLPPCIVFW
jgi:hypothetical protein